ncbi:DUF4097 family beta strand repeat-containing protein [Staphylococcus canis]|uniref:DUF4097 domain-containing protein n=1 Tax=Staphylococcus canis TaxID=2724942 RepID=A0ABS0T7N8_9STAP|nr:DUF4097 family beta strand repeat-containing protein [Staphylococcus canis]MBI5974771.1 DUF4097 domain-containing protein [Staphylococcus canis]
MKKLFLFGVSAFLFFFICGTVAWFGFEKDHHQLKNIEKVFNDQQFEHLMVQSNTADINVVEGKVFKVTYHGPHQLNLNGKGGTLKINEAAKTSKSMVNVNPFESHHGQLNIEVPKDVLEELHIQSRMSDINLNHLKHIKTTIQNEKHGGIHIKHSDFKNAYIYGNETILDVENSSFEHSEMNLNKGTINLNKTMLNTSVCKVKEGMIELHHAPSKISMKGSIKKGDILLNYLEAPQNTMFKIDSEKGKSYIQNQHIHRGKNGQGTYKVELYADRGDITVK